MSTVAPGRSVPASARGWRAEITRYHWLVLLTTLLGWGLDGLMATCMRWWLVRRSPSC
jgi:hypothetical protein